ncbi:hypothetical protein BJ322DRAFT_1075910 [Thelephora terrestris]|jgi:hypothetical protein|uniref:DUF1996 domain-containing protein n=1 Tax=Thelephora terrestris TaxID=56493 RepID=A0A9P6L4H8_9AGAM|nr:hypothetical protein BJ322DRAFT_1075910 [Thelephora terrestris]
MKSFLSILCVLAATVSTEAFWVMTMKNVLVTERVDPISSPGVIAPHVHTVTGGSNFGPHATSDDLRASKCTSGPIVEDKSNYWTPTLYFRWANGGFTSVDGTVSVKYLFNPGEATPFPDDFKMLAGSPASRSKNESDPISDENFLCLSPLAQASRHDALPALPCTGGLRSQVTFPSCWDGKNLDSRDHKSHVAFATGGKCTDPAYPVTLPQIQVEVHWDTSGFYSLARQALNPKQPFVFSNGDATGYGFYATFLNGWETKVLKQAVDECTCGMYGDIKCCADAGIFTVDTTSQCHITPHVKEQVQGTLRHLPGSDLGLESGPQRHFVTPPVLTTDVIVWTQPVIQKRPNWHRMMRRRG